MRLYERVIVFFICIAMAVISVLAILFSLKVFSLNYFWTRLVYLYGRWETGAIAGIFLVGSILILLSSFLNRKIPESVISNGEMGSVSISFNAVENLILKAANNIERLKDVKVKLKPQEDSLSIILNVTVAPDTNIPELTSELQRVVKDYVESMAGISVRGITVKVENIVIPQKQKVK